MMLSYAIHLFFCKYVPIITQQNVTPKQNVTNAHVFSALMIMAFLKPQQGSTRQLYIP